MDAAGAIVGRRPGRPVRAGAGNLLAALAAAGGRPDQLAGLTVYIVDMDDYQRPRREIGAVWRRLVGRDYPAMAGIGVPRLWDAEAVVEVQGLAVLP